MTSEDQQLNLEIASAVLLIDDNAIQAATRQAILRRAGYSVVAALNPLRAIEQLQPQDIAEAQACGRVPIRGLLRAARQHGLCARAVDLRNSGDTAGPRNQVVGYGAFVFEEI